MHHLPRRTSHALTAAFLAAAALFASACGGTATTSDTTTPAPTTLAPTTTSSTTTTTSTPTTTVPPTLPPLPVPEPVPPDGADEPEVVLGTIEIPAIGLSDTLYQGMAMSSLDRGPSHWPGTAMPGGYGNAVIGGHRTSHSRPFYDVDKLVAGDEIIYTTSDGTFVYEITHIFIVDPDDNWVISQTPGYTTTLFACHPKFTTDQRIIVRATLRDA
ncbi:MAG: sortase [Ilumatobacteraceae bacterium]